MSFYVDHIKPLQKGMPLPLRRAAGVLRRRVFPHPLWENKEFRDYFAFLQRSQWWSLEELKAYQLEKLKELVEFAYTKVPYYGRSFRDHGVTPKAIRTLDDIRLLPLLTKNNVRENIDAFIPVDVDRAGLKTWVTGGSSGIPLSVYLDPFYSGLIEEAFSLRQRVWAGYRFYERKVNLKRDRAIDPAIRKCWDFNSHENEIILNSHNMTEANMGEFVDVIRRFKPRYMVGFPSGLEIFAKFILRKDLILPQIRALFSGSEALFPAQRSTIESAFRCPVFSGYGMSERVVDAIECEKHCGYHINMEYGIMELLDKDNEPIREPDVPGVVVGTGFHNNVMPLIRYQMFDVAVLSGDRCACGRHSPLVRAFKGRIREYFVGKSGKLVPLQLIWSGRHPVWSRIKEMKFFQEQEGEILAKIVPAPEFPVDAILRDLRREVEKVLSGNDFDLRYEFVTSIPLTHRGKLNFLEQKLPLDFEDILDAGL